MNPLIMPNDDNDVIRYLSGEMDPTEEVLMEREMMEDDDLLIEVESMRQTMNRLDNLPEKNPSEELTNAIIEQAAEHQKDWFNVPTIPTHFYKYAAVLLLGMGLSSGFWMMLGPSAETEHTHVQTAAVEAALPASFNTVAAKETKVEPWVDHNNILYFQDRYSSNSTVFEGIIKASKKKVTPLEGPPVSTFRSQNIQLAGAQ